MGEIRLGRVDRFSIISQHGFKSQRVNQNEQLSLAWHVDPIAGISHQFALIGQLKRSVLVGIERRNETGVPLVGEQLINFGAPSLIRCLEILERLLDLICRRRGWSIRRRLCVHSSTISEHITNSRPGRINQYPYVGLGFIPPNSLAAGRIRPYVDVPCGTGVPPVLAAQILTGSRFSTATQPARAGRPCHESFSQRLQVVDACIGGDTIG